MAGKGGFWGSLGAQDLKENPLEMSCKELGQYHCLPLLKQGEPGAGNPNGGNG